MGSATPFVILTAPRTGSSWLVDSLNNHPQVVAHSELFVSEAREFEPRTGAMIYRTSTRMRGTAAARAPSLVSSASGSLT